MQTFPSFLGLTALFTVMAMFFSVVLVDWPKASAYRQQNFNMRDALWAGVVACSVAWPIGVIYAFPTWYAAVIVTGFCVLLTYELMFPMTELKDWRLFQSVPRHAWLILGFFSVLSTWVTLLYFWTELAQGRPHPGIIFGL